jgi:hypothetical protein
LGEVVVIGRANLSLRAYKLNLRAWKYPCFLWCVQRSGVSMMLLNHHQRKVGVCSAEAGEAGDTSLKTDAEGGLQQIVSSQVAAFRTMGLRRDWYRG